MDYPWLQLLSFQFSRILYSDSSSHTQLCIMKRQKESKSCLVEHCCLVIWIFTTESEHEINPFSGIMLVLFDEPPHCHILPTVAQNTPYTATRDFPKQCLWLCKKVQQTFSPPLLSLLESFLTALQKHKLFLSHSQYISTTCFEAAVYNNPPPCHNPFKRTKKKAVVPEDYFFQSLEVFSFGIARYLHILRQIHDPVPNSNASLSSRSSPMHHHELIWDKK